MDVLISETYLKAKPSWKRQLARILLIALAVVFLLVGLFFMLLLQTPLVLCVMVILDVIIFFLMPSNKIAYEYIFVDGQIDFDRIINGEKRKTMKRLDMDKMEIAAPENSHALDAYKNTSFSDYSSGLSTDKHWIAVFWEEKKVEKVRFTPDEKMLRMMKMKSHSKIVEY